MIPDPSRQCTAFEGHRRIAAGELAEVAVKARQAMDRDGHGPILILDDETSRVIEVDLRGTAGDVAGRFAALAVPAAPESTTPDSTPRGRGRPRLGVVAREVTLLPRHWEWLNGQPGGASVALRKLVEEARRANETQDRRRLGQEALYRFMTILAGDLPGFEEASRALFTGQRDRFADIVGKWPEDLRSHALMLSPVAFGDDAARR